MSEPCCRSFQGNIQAYECCLRNQAGNYRERQAFFNRARMLVPTSRRFRDIKLHRSCMSMRTARSAACFHVCMSLRCACACASLLLEMGPLTSGETEPGRDAAVPRAWLFQEKSLITRVLPRTKQRAPRAFAMGTKIVIRRCLPQASASLGDRGRG